MQFIIDIETNNLLQQGLDYDSLPYKLKPDYKIWCVVVRNITNKSFTTFYGSLLTKSNIEEALEGCTEIIGHNIVGFDLPVLKLYGLIDYSIGYPGEQSTLFGIDCKITDTLLWSKLLNADRLGGHSLEAWGKRLNEPKSDFHEWDRFSQEMLNYCIQDTAVNAKLYLELVKEKHEHNWETAYAMELKLADLTLKQELFGFEFDVAKANKNIEELTLLMQNIAVGIDPLLPKKRMSKAQASDYMPPKIRFKKDGSVSMHMQNFLTKLNATLVDNNSKILYESELFPITIQEPLKTETTATVEDIDVVKSYLLEMGWIPTEVKERDLVKNQDKSLKSYDDIIAAIDRYVNQTESSLFKELRLDMLDVSMHRLRDFLVSKIDGNKPIYVPTTPKLTVGVEKEICPNLISLGEKAEFVKEVVHYYTYRHRKNSIAGGALDEDGEPETGFLSYVRSDGRIPTPADTLGANTGRYRHKIVCNVPRVTSLYGEQMRSLFGSGKGLWQVGYDFASLEARIMGHYVMPYTEGKELATALIAEKPNDIHSINARKLGIDRSSAKSFSYACLPMQTKVLTAEGWKYYEDIQIGESLPTFNAETGLVEMDTVSLKHFFSDKQVFKYSNKHSSFECTEDHRWYGWRRSKTKGKPSKNIQGFFNAKDFTSEHNIVLTAPFVGNMKSNVTPDEARFIGYVLADGSINWSKAQEITSSSKGSKKGVRLSLTQSKNKFWKEIEDLLNVLGLTYTKAITEKSNGNDMCYWVISQPKARAFIDKVVGVRKDKHEINWTKWVLSLSRESLEAFYEGFYNGDGDLCKTHEVISQNLGTIHEAIVATCQLLGKGRVSINKHSGTNKVCEGIRTQRIKHMTMQEVKSSSLGVQDTFCLTTKNSSFIIWQDNFIGITGNCIYGAQPKKLSKMIGVNETEGKRLFQAYWDAVPALKELKAKVEKAWERSGKKTILGLDGRLLNTRSKHSLINVLFQSGGAIAAKWSAVRLAQAMEQQDILGDPFVHSTAEPKVWWLIHVHDEQQMAVHPSLLNVKVYRTEEEAKADISTGCSAIGHGSKGPYLAFKTKPIECIEEGIKVANQELGLRVKLGFEYIAGKTWAQCH